LPQLFGRPDPAHERAEPGIGKDGLPQVWRHEYPGGQHLGTGDLTLLHELAQDNVLESRHA
jgi:hypothetical protein